MFRVFPHFAALRYLAAIVACYGGWGTALHLAWLGDYPAAWRAFLIGCAGFGVNVSPDAGFPGTGARRAGDSAVTGESPYIGRSGEP
jgi:hypothetical protein